MSSWRTRSLSVSDHPPVYARQADGIEPAAVSGQSTVPCLSGGCASDRADANVAGPMLRCSGFQRCARADDRTSHCLSLSGSMARCTSVPARVSRGSGTAWPAASEPLVRPSDVARLLACSSKTVYARGCERLPTVRAPRAVGSLQSRACKEVCRGSRREPPDPRGVVRITRPLVRCFEPSGYLLDAEEVRGSNPLAPIRRGPGHRAFLLERLAGSEAQTAQKLTKS
jgi:hypothetical protein